MRPIVQTQSSGGIVFPQQYIQDSMKFEVLAVGPGKVNRKGILIPPEVEPGDIVVAPLYLTHTILGDGTRISDASQLLLKCREQAQAGGSDSGIRGELCSI